VKASWNIRQADYNVWIELQRERLIVVQSSQTPPGVWETLAPK
jgi:hypothetical protein